MIIKSALIDGFDKFSDYLTGEGPNRHENEKCNFIASHNGLEPKTWCFLANEMVALKRRGKNPLKKPIEHIMWRTRQGDLLTPEMVKPRVKLLLEKMGYQNCPWILVQHMKVQKNGEIEPHYHIGVCRIDKAGKIPHPRSYYICREMADEFAKDFGFQEASAGRHAQRYVKRACKLTGLWGDALSAHPVERLTHFMKHGFIPVQGNRGQLVFVDTEGKPHSPLRIPYVRKAKLKQVDIPKVFGLAPNDVALLPSVDQAARATKRGDWKLFRKIIAGVIATEQNRYEAGPIILGKDFKLYQEPVRWVGLPSIIRQHDLKETQAKSESLKPGFGPSYEPGQSGPDFDSMVSGRAAAATEAVRAKYAVMLEAAHKDPSLTVSQREATIRQIKFLEDQEAKAAERQIIETEEQAFRATRQQFENSAPKQPNL